MEIKYEKTPVQIIDIKIQNDTIKMGFVNEDKQLFAQVITLYSQNGTNVGQAGCTLNKEELKQYISTLEEMYKQM